PGTPLARRGRPDGIQVVTVKLSIGAGPPRVVVTDARTVGALLHAMHLRISRLRRVTPRPASLLAEGITIRAVPKGHLRPVEPEEGQAVWFQSAGMCAASPTLPAGAAVIVTNQDNGRAVT